MDAQGTEQPRDPIVVALDEVGRDVGLDRLPDGRYRLAGTGSEP